VTTRKTISAQIDERGKCLHAIISSKARRKIILAGAGTGKTFTLKRVLLANPGGQSIAMTFINRLTKDMNTSFGNLAEVKTFHAYCKKILHEQNGSVELEPFLTTIIEDDARCLRKPLKDFDRKFQILDEESPEVAFYLSRGDYYDTVSFNDSVYRLFKKLRSNSCIVPRFNQILIDEYQDFNPLEVAFIDELEKRGSILIIGDDDQAVYDERCASPNYLRDKYKSGKYEIFELPFCSRCPEVIVNAANAFLANAEANGFLKGRIRKRYECYLEEKGEDSTRFQKIVTARCTTAKVVAKYVDKVIQNISKDDIRESWKEGSEYYAALIVGPKQYLVTIQKELSSKYPQMMYTPNKESPLNPVNAYDLLLKDESSNLGWRVLINFYFKLNERESFIAESTQGRQMIDVLDREFVKEHREAIEIIQAIRAGADFTQESKDALRRIVKDHYDAIVENYSPKEKAEEVEQDKTKPSILLSSFVGCKGLSAGHVIIVGANDGSLPKDPCNISDVEIAQFLVALTRTRKQCYIISNQWLFSPRSKGTYQQPYRKSCFLNWIPPESAADEGVMRSADIK
jgi:superfamily I DNA/RNA helicase